VHPGERILPELHRNPRLVEWSERQIADMGIETCLKTRVAAATAEEAILNDGRRIATRTIISCAGTAQSPLLDGLDLPRDERGRVIVDEFLQVKDHPGVWAAGDCAAVPHPNGGTCPALGIFAVIEGRQIAENIKRAVNNKPLKKFTFAGIGLACSIGPHKAAAEIFGLEFTGLFAWLVWRLTLLNFVPTWDRKIRLAIDWLIVPMVGRDIVNMKMDPQYGIRRELFEVGQEIVAQGDVGRRMYLIWSGEVEVLRQGPDGAEILATLGAGQHFGEISVFQDIRRTATVRARTRVELVSIGQQEALALSAATDAFGSLKSLPQSGPAPRE
jgi:NADH dehydrogenase